MAMTFKKVSAVATCVLLLAGCMDRPLGQAYWQRVEDDSALYMTGPKAQQTLEENIASCAYEIRELVKLDAMRETMPPDTHSEYHRALNESSDLSYYDTPVRIGDKKVAHSDYHDYESCMRSKGWERVNFVRYQTAVGAKSTYRDTRLYRETGLIGEAAVAKKKQEAARAKADFSGVNQ